MASAPPLTAATLEKKSSHSSASIDNEKQTPSPSRRRGTRRRQLPDDSESSRRHSLVRVMSLVGLALLILGWWISSVTIHATRHRWIVQTIFAWAFILIIAFRFIPNSVVTRPVEAVWVPVVQEPFFRIPKYIQFALGWLSTIAVVLGSAFGFKLDNVRHRRCLVFLPHLLIRNSLGHELWRSRDLHPGSHFVPVWFLGDLEEPVRHPMAHRHRRSVRPAGDRPLRAQIRRRLPHLQMARDSRFRLPCPGPCRRCLLLRPRHRQHKALVLCQRGMSFCDL